MKDFHSAPDLKKQFRINQGSLKKKGEKILELSVKLYIQICERKEKHMTMTERPQSRWST